MIVSSHTVIGSGGFIGSRVVATLRSLGLEPRCPARDDPALWTDDLGHVVYCAGLTGDFRTQPFATVEAHVSLLAQLIERASFERIVYLSSTRIYDLLADGIGAEDRSIPVNSGDVEHLYELSKMLGENLILHRCGGRGVVARLSYVFDWGDDAQGFLSEWLSAARESRSLTVNSNPDAARDYIHVDDVAAALITLVDGETRGIVNVARGETLSNAQIAALLEKRGWTVNFARSAGSAAHPVSIDTSRLTELGAGARPVLPLIDEYLAGIS